MQQALLCLPLERPLFLREHATGTYCALAYALEKLAVDLLLGLSQSLLEFAIVYWMMGLHGSFLLHVLNSAALTAVVAATALPFGCLASTPAEASGTEPLVFVPQFVFAGYFLQIPKVWNER